MYRYVYYVADGTTGASCYSRPELRSPEPSASISRSFVSNARRSCKSWCHLHAVPRERRVGSQAQQLGQGRIREEPLTNGVGRIYLMGPASDRQEQDKPSCVEAAEAVEAVECATQNLVELIRAGLQHIAAGSERLAAQQRRERKQASFTSRNRMRPLSRIAPASFRTGATARRGRAAANQKAGRGGRSSTRRATPWRGCTTDSRRSCQTPVFARSGGALAWFVRPAVGATPSNIVLCEPGLCELQLEVERSTQGSRGGP